jgi:hypothetical protein
MPRQNAGDPRNSLIPSEKIIRENVNQPPLSPPTRFVSKKTARFLAGNQRHTSHGSKIATIGSYTHNRKDLPFFLADQPQ